MKSHLSALIALIALHAFPASSQTAFDSLYVTNGNVSTVVVSGNTIYIGGSFTSVGPGTSAGVVVDTATGIVDAAFPAVGGGL